MENLLFKDIVQEFELKEVDDGFLHIKGYASTFGNKDRVGDIVKEGAFSMSLTERMPKLLYQHNISEPIGVIDKAYETEIGLIIEARLPKSNSQVQDLIPLIKMGALSDFSIGFNIVDSEMQDDNTRILKEIALWEVSIVTIPANAKARILSVKSVVPYKDLPIGSREKPWDSAAAIKRVKEFTKSTESPSATYKNAFLWYDASNAENFTAYKLPIADVIDGKLTAIPRGVFAAAAALSGARGGVDIPANEKQSIINNLNKYYKKMDMESPFNKSAGNDMDEKTIDAFKAESISTKREFEAMLRDTGMFTKKAAVILASRFIEAEGEPIAKAGQSDSEDVRLLLEAIEKTKQTFNKGK